MDPAGIHDIDCVLATQEIAELIAKPVPIGEPRIEWDEKRWEAMEAMCSTAFDDVLMSSGGVLQSLLKMELLSRPAARLVFVLFVGNSTKRNGRMGTLYRFSLLLSRKMQEVFSMSELCPVFSPVKSFYKKAFI